jgi:hypothetical protein
LAIASPSFFEDGDLKKLSPEEKKSPRPSQRFGTFRQ